MIRDYPCNMVALMMKKNLHCATTDVMCREVSVVDDVLYALNSTAQRSSRYLRPFAAGMFMTDEKARLVQFSYYSCRRATVGLSVAARSAGT